jgi:hypothetical protein
VILFDRMLVGGVGFILDQLAAAAEAELNDEASVREQLLAAQLRLEAGELSPAEFAEVEESLFARMRAVCGAGEPIDLEASGAVAEVTFEPDER